MLGKKSLAVHLDSVVPPLSAPGGRLGGGVVSVLGSLGAATSLAWACLRALRHPRIYLPLTFAQALLTAAAHVDEAALGARALVRDLHARPERYIRVSLF
jgi:hypothetical protein